ncbi:hypothetical protein SISNIDRAFT_467372 [Sistotremastrum niveocremeum HHB9708]|uniref:Uncharacterized protein n=1 Tax=Sistotremastrum niveocremeum HHB9708 TaxID=1314777 RepID=A0A164SSV9_9AGAM|nr:hypothetical protein SISNIDRAFT_467372 [Sistotremastrum niveocremeum HHB9708]
MSALQASLQASSGSEVFCSNHRSLLADACAEFKTKVANILLAANQESSYGRSAAVEDSNALETTDQQFSSSIQAVKWRYNQKAPATRLANELIAEILQYCRLPQIFRFMRSVETPGAFSVCKRWRDVAITTPSLWTQVILPMHLKLFPLLVERSGNRLLDVYLTNRGRCEEGSLRTSLGIPFRQIASRIYRLSIYWQDDDIGSQTLDRFLKTYILKENKEEFSALRSLEIHDWESDDPSPKKTVSISTPLLSQMTLVGNLRAKPLVSPQKLVDLTVETCNMNSADILGLLSYYSNLKRCDIWNEYPDFDEIARPTTKVSLRYLQSLSLRSLCASEMDHLLQHLSWPDAADITVCVSKDKHDPVLFEHILGPWISHYPSLKISRSYVNDTLYELDSDARGKMKFIRRKADEEVPSLPFLASYQNVLNDLILDLPHLPPLHDLVQCFHSWSLIDYLAIVTTEEEFEKLLSALEAERDGQVILPLLAGLNCSETRFRRQRMETFLEFRKRKGVPLKYLTATRGFSSPNAEGLEALVEEYDEVAPIPPKSIDRLYNFPGESDSDSVE